MLLEDQWVVAPVRGPAAAAAMGIPLQITATKDAHGALRVRFDPGLGVQNDTPWPLVLALSTRATDERAGRGGPAAQPSPAPEVRVLAPGSVTRCAVPLPLRPAEGRDDAWPRWRVWLDGGWSRPVDLVGAPAPTGLLDRDWRQQPAPPFVELWPAAAASAPASVPDGPATLLWGAQTRGAGAAVFVRSVRLCFPARLRNELPFAVQAATQALLSNQARGPSGAAARLPALDRRQRLDPGDTADLGVAVTGGVACLLSSAVAGEEVSERLGSASAAVAGKPPSTTHPRHIAIVLPPLSANDAEALPATSIVGQTATASLLGYAPTHAARPGEWAEATIAHGGESASSPESSGVPCRLVTHLGPRGLGEPDQLLLRLVPCCRLINQLGVAVALEPRQHGAAVPASPAAVVPPGSTCPAGQRLWRAPGLEGLESDAPPRLSLALYPRSGDGEADPRPFATHDLCLQDPDHPESSGAAADSLRNWRQHVILRREDPTGVLETAIVVRVAQSEDSKGANQCFSDVLLLAA